MAAQNARRTPTEIEVSVLRNFFEYSPSTGTVSRTIGRSHQEAGAALTATDARGYVFTRFKIEGRVNKLYCHTLAWLLHYGKWPEEEVGHRNGNRSDNRLDNLFLMTESIQSHRKKRGKNNSSGVKGVFWDASRQLWKAEIMCCGARKWLGRFTNKEDAAAAYISAAEDLYGENAAPDFDPEAIRPRKAA